MPIPRLQHRSRPTVIHGDAYDRGREDFIAGRPVAENPYRGEGMMLEVEWYSGWCHEEADFMDRPKLK